MKKGILLLSAICLLGFASCTCGNKTAQKEEAPAAATEKVEQTPVQEEAVAEEAVAEEAVAEEAVAEEAAAEEAVAEETVAEETNKVIE